MDTPRNFGKTIWGMIIGFCIVIILLLLFSRWSPERKAQIEEKKDAKATQRLLARGVLNDICAEIYPVKDSIIKGDSVLVLDTLYIPGEISTDTLIEKDTVRITTTKTLPSKTIIKTVHVIDTIVRENTANIEACKDDNRKLIDLLTVKTKESDTWKGKAKKRNIIIFILAGAIGMWTFIKLKSKFTKPKI